VAIGKLSALQEDTLEALAGVRPAWTLTGGGALAGFHTKHRDTRDLDLFFRGEQSLGTIPAEIVRILQAAGFTAVPLRTSHMFAQLDVRRGGDAIVLDLVADPTPLAEPPAPTAIGATTILVETPHQLLVNKLCALLSRSELRDLVDVRALLGAGGDLLRALLDCPKQDAGFSPLTFGWAVRGLPIARLAGALGWSQDDISALDAFKDELVDRVVQAAHP
jgi:hypothetical protein